MDRADPAMPFEKVSAIFAAFAHAYPQGNGRSSLLSNRPNRAEYRN